MYDRMSAPAPHPMYRGMVWLRSVAYNPRYDELAITVKPEDLLTKGKVHIVSDVRRWLE